MLQFYLEEGRHIMSSSTTSEYLLYAERRLQREMELAQVALPRFTHSKLSQCVEEALLSSQAVSLITSDVSGLPFMLTHAKHAESIQHIPKALRSKPLAIRRTLYEAEERLCRMLGELK